MNFLIGPFVKKRGAKILHFHKPGSTDMFDFVPRELLPTEYGGSAGSLAEIHADFRQQIEAQRSYLMDTNNWVVKGLNTDGTFGANYEENSSKLKDN